MSARLPANSPAPSTVRGLSCLGLSLCVFGCATATGAVDVTAYGEDFIEEGIPAEEVNDGWAIDFSRFEVTFAEVTVGGVVLADAVTVDLAQASDGDGQVLGVLDVAEGNYDESSFAIERVEVDGSATLNGQEKTFSWVFDDAVSYHECETTTAVVDDETATFQITVHADHLFYDSLVAEEPRLLFQPLADADANADGDITAEELAATDIGAYDPGSAGGIDDLWAFHGAQTATLGHVDGEGHCHSTPLD